MNIVSWNIQAGLGLDGEVDLSRIANVLRALPFHTGNGPDVICLQEVSRHFSALTNGTPDDQPAQLEALFPEYTCIFRPAVDLGPYGNDTAGKTRQFGCMILSRFPVSQVFNRLLTQQGAGGKRMQRHVLEAIVEAPSGPVRVATTHLEFNSHPCRLAQVDQILSDYQETLNTPTPSSLLHTDSPYSAAPRPTAAIVCGDFNFLTDSPEYQRLTATNSGFQDAWCLLDGKQRSFFTCGFDNAVQWPEGPHCRDFFFITNELADNVTQIGVDTETRASDHQPIYLTVA